MALFQSGEVGTGLILIGIGATGMGLLMALALTVSADEAEKGYQVDASRVTMDSMSIAFREFSYSEYIEFPIYIQVDGFYPAAGVFLARINGERAIVIERAEPVDDRTEVLRPVFSDREGM